MQAVRAFLQERVSVLAAAGVVNERIALDPGVGFGKTVEQNFSLLAQQAALQLPGHPWLVGWSRKSSLGAVTGLDLSQGRDPVLARAAKRVGLDLDPVAAGTLFPFEWK